VDFKEYMQIVGENIRVQRKNKKLSRKSLEEKINTTQQYIGQIERGEANPTLEVLHRIADALDITIPVLLGDYSDKLGLLIKKYKFPDKNDVYRLLSSMDNLDKSEIDMVIKMIIGLKK